MMLTVVPRRATSGKRALGELARTAAPSTVCKRRREESSVDSDISVQNRRPNLPKKHSNQREGAPRHRPWSGPSPRRRNAAAAAAAARAASAESADARPQWRPLPPPQQPREGRKEGGEREGSFVSIPRVTNAGTVVPFDVFCRRGSIVIRGSRFAGESSAVVMGKSV